MAYGSLTGWFGLLDSGSMPRARVQAVTGDCGAKGCGKMATDGWLEAHIGNSMLV